VSVGVVSKVMAVAPALPAKRMTRLATEEVTNWRILDPLVVVFDFFISYPQETNAMPDRSYKARERKISFNSN
jgi:hypothetical protein